MILGFMVRLWENIINSIAPDGLEPSSAAPKAAMLAATPRGYSKMLKIEWINRFKNHLTMI